MDVAPPLCSGRYRLVAVLGTGGMATVYRAYDALLDVFRAVKVLDAELTQRRKTRERFLMEARTMAKLRHENVVAVYDMGVDGDRVYMLMELVDGGSLMDRIDSHGPLPPRMACDVMVRVLDALDASHQIGVIHRDVKPHNVLVTIDGNPKVTDFGIASVHDADHDLTRTGAVMGTWAYMAPEQRKNAKIVDPRADVYAAGATLFLLVTGVEPLDLYVPDSHDEALGGLLPPLVDLIRTATRYKPDERYASASAFRDALAARLAELPPDPEDASPLSVPAERLPRYLRPETTDFDVSLRTDSVDRPRGASPSSASNTATARGSDRTFSLADDADVVRVAEGTARAVPTPSAVVRVEPKVAPRKQAPQQVARPPPRDATVPPPEGADGGWAEWGTPPPPPPGTPPPAPVSGDGAGVDDDAEAWLYAMATSATPAATPAATPPTTLGNRLLPESPAAGAEADPPVMWTPPPVERALRGGAPAYVPPPAGVEPVIHAGLHEIRVVPQGLRIQRRGLGWLVPGRPRVTLVSCGSDGEVYRTNLGGKRGAAGAQAPTPMVKETASSVANALTRRDGSTVAGPRSLAGLAATTALAALLVRLFGPGLPWEFFVETAQGPALAAQVERAATGAIALSGAMSLAVPWWLAGRWLASLRVLFYDLAPERQPAWTAVDAALSEVAAAADLEVVLTGKGSTVRRARLARALPSGLAANLGVWRLDVLEARLYVLPDMLLVWKDRRLRVLRWKEVELLGDGNVVESFDLDQQMKQKGPSHIEMRLRARGLDVLLRSKSAAMGRLPGALGDLAGRRDALTG